MELFKIMLGNRKAEFTVIGIADVFAGTVKFQALMNGVPFTEGPDYEKIRARVVKAVEINQNHEKEN